MSKDYSIKLTEKDIVNLFRDGLTIDRLADRVKYRNDFQKKSEAKQYVENVIYNYHKGTEIPFTPVEIIKQETEKDKNQLSFIE